MRVTVAEEGRHSTGLLPIPADRQRAQPLPEDIIDIELLLADRSGAIPDDELDVLWFWCPAALRCPFGGVEWNEPPACTDDFDPREPCRFSSDVRPLVAMPKLDPGYSAFEQSLRTIVAVVGVRHPAGECFGLLRGERADPEVCVGASRRLHLGPPAPFVVAAETDGVELGFEPDEVGIDLAPLAQPNFHPEIPRLVLKQPITGDTVVAAPGTSTQVPPNAELHFESVEDARDAQAYGDLVGARFGEAGVTRGREGLSSAFFSTEPDRIRRSSILVTGDPGDSASILAVLADGRDGHSWAWFDFEVVGQ